VRIALPLAALGLLAAAPARTPPSAEDFQSAMDRSLLSEVDQRNVLHADCRRVTQLQCRPLAGDLRYRCTYVSHPQASRPRRGVALIERDAEQGWRWISGSKVCSVFLLH
jgi:hypothetical protein